MATKKIRTYTGDAINVTYDVKRCIHAAECVKGLPSVFNLGQKPWVQPDKGEAAEIIAVVQRCPSGALQVEGPDGSAVEPVPAKNVLHIDPNGPLYLYGDIVVSQRDGTVIVEDTRVALCRCGASENKPFCDAAHEKIEFSDPGLLGSVQHKSKDSPAEDSRLHVITRPNGPVMVQGQVEIKAADGESTTSQTRMAFCRCGGSSNKPFCDGTHNENGFEAG